MSAVKPMSYWQHRRSVSQVHLRRAGVNFECSSSKHLASFHNPARTARTVSKACVVKTTVCRL